MQMKGGVRRARLRAASLEAIGKAKGAPPVEVDLARTESLRRFNANHYPKGSRGGQFAPAAFSSALMGASAKHPRDSGPPNPGRAVQLPGGAREPYPQSPTGYLMSPKPDLRDVAAAGRVAGASYSSLSAVPGMSDAAQVQLYVNIGRIVGTDGAFDYQRSGNFIFGFNSIHNLERYQISMLDYICNRLAYIR